MAEAAARQKDLEGIPYRTTGAALGFQGSQYQKLGVSVAPFAGRLGGCGCDIKSPTTDGGAPLVPDASPCKSWAEMFEFRAFKNIILWKAALMESMGTLMLVWLTGYANLSPDVDSEPPTPRWGLFDNAAFIGPLVGGIFNFLYLTIFTYCFGAVSGAHLNPMITMATFCARLCSFPRACMYIPAQIAGASLGGLLLRAAYGSRSFKVGGCWLFTDEVPVSNAFVVELMACTILLFFAFGVGLDPRQRETIGPTLGPFLVGLALGSLSFGTAFSRFGYGGASMNPARCFGVFVGSRIPGWHWIHWVGPAVASVTHGVFYHLVPPWQHGSE